MTTTPDRLEEIRARLGAATRRPWKWAWRRDDHNAPGSVYGEPFTGHAYAVAMCPRYGKEEFAPNAEFIANAPEDIQYLITRLEASEAEVERLRDLVMESAPVSWAGQGWDGGGVDAAQAWEKRVVELLGKEPTGTTAAPKEHEAMG